MYYSQFAALMTDALAINADHTPDAIPRPIRPGICV
jgi:hypothetical protein